MRFQNEHRTGGGTLRTTPGARRFYDTNNTRPAYAHFGNALLIPESDIDAAFFFLSLSPRHGGLINVANRPIVVRHVKMYVKRAGVDIVATLL